VFTMPVGDCVGVQLLPAGQLPLHASLQIYPAQAVTWGHVTPG